MSISIINENNFIFLLISYESTSISMVSSMDLFFGGVFFYDYPYFYTIYLGALL